MGIGKHCLEQSVYKDANHDDFFYVQYQVFASTWFYLHYVLVLELKTQK